MSHPALRFVVSALIAAIASVVVATLSLPLASQFGSDAINMTPETGFLANVIVTLAFIVIAIPVGGMLALPTAVIMGGAMIWLIARRPQADRALVWAVAAVLGSIPSGLFVGGAYDINPDRIIIWLWLAFSAIVGALVFRWRWRKA